MTDFETALIEFRQTELAKCPPMHLKSVTFVKHPRLSGLIFVSMRYDFRITFVDVIVAV